MSLNEKMGKQQAVLLATSVRRTLSLLVAIGSLSLVIGLVASVLLVRRMNTVLNSVVDSVSTGTDQIASASGQVSASSQSLAEGASEQAASIEETSSSLEEMSSMAKRNADNANKVGELSKRANQTADRGLVDMESMSQAMQGIKESSDQVAKIIKTIDEIAFQTNILALNAAVEAARAGEAGMGFAVVAEEVRSLAQRSAIAAKETADKIETAIQRTSQGVEISTKVQNGLSEIVAQIKQVDQLVADVSTASREQCQGIEQVNIAVNQMDKVTQSNAANAEESASASEELNAQAETLRDAVGELNLLVGGSLTAGSQRSDIRGSEAKTRKTTLTLAKKPSSAGPNGNDNHTRAISPIPTLAPSKDRNGSLASM
jgi:methyl-accepting chemotaxis protein